MSEINALQRVYECAREQDDSERNAIAAVITAGGIQDVVRREYILGRMANTLDCDRVNAERVLDAKGANSKDAERRTEIQEKAYGAARVAWSGLIKKAGLTSTETRGGASRLVRSHQKGRADDSSWADTESGTAPEAIHTPPCETREQVMTFLRSMSAVLSKFENRNAKVLDIETRPVIEDFIAGVKLLEIAAREQIKKAA
jgi:hypothetical protein